MASLTQWTWVWVNSGSWWWTVKPGVLQSTGSQRVGHDSVTRLNWDVHALWKYNVYTHVPLNYKTPYFSYCLRLLACCVPSTFPRLQSPELNSLLSQTRSLPLSAVKSIYRHQVVKKERSVYCRCQARSPGKLVLRTPGLPKGVLKKASLKARWGRWGSRVHDLLVWFSDGLMVVPGWCHRGEHYQSSASRSPGGMCSWPSSS